MLRHKTVSFPTKNLNGEEGINTYYILASIEFDVSTLSEGKAEELADYVHWTPSIKGREND